MIRCFHGFYLSIREDAWRRPSDEAVQDRTGTCRAGERHPEGTLERARGDARCVIQSSERAAPSVWDERVEPSGQGRFVTKRSLAGVRRYGKLEGSIARESVSAMSPSVVPGMELSRLKERRSRTIPGCPSSRTET